MIPKQQVASAHTQRLGDLGVVDYWHDSLLHKISPREECLAHLYWVISLHQMLPTRNRGTASTCAPSGMSLSAPDCTAIAAEGESVAARWTPR